jgi:hypothetical protein
MNQPSWQIEPLVEACIKDRWLGARVQRLNAVGGIVHERIIG